MGLSILQELTALREERSIDDVDVPGWYACDSRGKVIEGPEDSKDKLSAEVRNKEGGEVTIYEITSSDLTEDKAPLDKASKKQFDWERMLSGKLSPNDYNKKYKTGVKKKKHIKEVKGEEAGVGLLYVSNGEDMDAGDFSDVEIFLNKDAYDKRILALYEQQGGDTDGRSVDDLSEDEEWDEFVEQVWMHDTF